jgi:CHAT domain-containing protein
MKYFYLSLLLFTCASSIVAKNDCCDFTIHYFNLAQEAPEEEELAACYLNAGCDKLYYFAGKMINACKKGDMEAMHNNFEDALPIIDNHPKEYELSLRFAYLYASYLEEEGELVIASAYYSYVKNNAKSKTTLQYLAKIGHAGVYASEEATVSLVHDVMKSINYSTSITADQRMAIIIRSGYLLPFEVITDLYQENYRAYEGSKSKSLKNLFLTHAEHHISQIPSVLGQKILREIREKSNEYSLREKKTLWNKILAQRALQSHDYEGYLEFSKLALENKVGPFESAAQSIKKLKLLERNYIHDVFRYANSNLYQTRLGKGIVPVINAFDIYEIGFSYLLKIKLQSVNSLVSENKNKVLTKKYTPLIVGTYLYQNTNDPSYLSRSISLLDGFSSGGSQYWTLARERMRRDKGFAAAIEKEQALAEAMKHIAPQMTLTEIHRQQQDLITHRDKIQEDFPDFFEQLTTGYKIDLEEVQSDLTVDTTGLVSFYLNNAILYRLFISPDTIAITPMNESRSEVLALTEELAEAIPAGKSAELTKKASRRLYQLLFTGIDSLLSERLHVVTNGKLEAIPFAALRRDTASGAPRYLGIECAISSQSSIREMQMLEALDLAPRYAQPLGMAPSFTNELLQASDLRQAGFKLPPLVFNTEEVRDLEDRSAGQYYFDGTATIDHYIEDASDYGIIHLATHAISSQTDGLRSHLYLLDDSGEPVQLYASDIGDQTLNANLVVLSACETGGGGRHATEGRVGLTKAYLAAGARSVVSSNWAVDDHATAELMGSFYEQLEQGHPPHEALQYSRKTYLERHPDAAPYKWAAFEAHGGMKPVTWKQHDSMWPSLGYGAAVAFLSVILGSYFSRRRINK